MMQFGPKKMLKEKIFGVDKGYNKDNRVNMTISATQVSAVIRTYLKNTKDRLENVTNLSRNLDDVSDEVMVSDDAKKILFERIGKRVVEKLKNEMAQNY
jgi:predicted RNase H-like nuclease